MKTLLLLLILLLAAAPQKNDYVLTVTVSGIKPLKGDLYVSLHNRSEYFQLADSAFLNTKIEVKEETATLIFNNIPEGRYAMAIYHDMNLNGIMDVNENGIPREGYGFSTKSRFLGRPKFEQAAFEVNRNDTVEIKMLYHAGPGLKKDTIR